MRIRKVEVETGDMVFGGDQLAIERDSPDAVGILVEARLNLWQGQFYLDLAEGTPYEQQVLGRRTEGLRDAALQARILDTMGVAEITAYNSVLDRQSRTLAVATTVQTAYSRSALAGSATSIDLNVKVEDGR